MTQQQIDAMKLALEALEEAHYKMEHYQDEEKREQAITAIKEALAEHAMRETQRLGQEIEQEPVAWRNAAIRVGEDLSSVGPDGYYDMTAQQWLDWALSVVTVHAPPPQRKPLTDAQIFALENSVPDEIVSDRDWCIHFARAIEAAHGIKENT